MRLSSIRNGALAFLALSGLVGCGGGSGSGADGGMSAPSALSYPNPQAYTVGTPITALTAAVTGAVASYSVSPSLPAGLILDAASGQIAGTPAMAAPTATYTITARNSAGSTTFPLSITVNASFSLEPATATTIGQGQIIALFATLSSSSADPYPSYIDPALIAWTSSRPEVATIDSSGSLTGLSEGTTVVTARYQGLSSPLAVQVAGQWVERDIAVPGQGTRRYSIYVPSFDGGGPHPVIVSFHGGGGSAMIQASTSQLNEFAHEQQVYVVYPQGSGAIRTHNAGSCCGFAQAQDIDDVRYLQALLDDVEVGYSVQAARIFVTGFSNGGMMSHRLACAVADRIAAITAIGGGSGQFDNSLNPYYACNPARPIPVLHIHAANDRNYPFAGGFGAGVSATDFYPIDATIADWVARNNVTSIATVENVTATTTCYRYSATADVGRPSAPVALCKTDPPDVYDPVNEIVFGGGHSWPAGVRSPAANSDVPITDFDANAYMWGFFNQ